MKLVGRCADLACQMAFDRLIGTLQQKKWIVYAKRPFAGPKQVLDYLGRYTHRVAISNHRIVALTGKKVTFIYRDRSDQNKKRPCAWMALNLSDAF